MICYNYCCVLISIIIYLSYCSWYYFCLICPIDHHCPNSKTLSKMVCNEISSYFLYSGDVTFHKLVEMWPLQVCSGRWVSPAQVYDDVGWHVWAHRWSIRYSQPYLLLSRICVSLLHLRRPVPSLPVVWGTFLWNMPRFRRPLRIQHRMVRTT